MPKPAFQNHESMLTGNIYTGPLLSHKLPLPPGESWGDDCRDAGGRATQGANVEKGRNVYTVVYSFHVLLLATAPCNAFIHALTVLSVHPSGTAVIPDNIAVAI